MSYAPNALGQATQAGGYATAASYHPNGQLKSFNYGNGLTFTQSVDSEYRPYERQVKAGSTLRVGQRYSYDANDNLNGITDLVNSSKDISLGFDGLDRLTSASGYWGSGSMSYDSLGNITTKTLGTQALTYSYNSNNQLSSVTGGYSFSYDGRGTVLHNGKRGFSVNRANQMTGSDGVSYSYDGHNRRVKKVNGGKTQYSFYSQSGQFLSTTGTNGPTEYVYLGSQLVAQVSQVTTADDKPGYTGHLEDKDIGLTYMQQRYYDPVVGRFYSNDPVGFSADNPITFNRYAYGNNNPYKFVDPDGRESIGIMAMERDIIALADGSLSKEDYKTNQQARAVGAMVGAAFALTNLSATSSIGRLASFNSKRSGHIFRQADDHVSPSTQSSRDRMADLFEDVTSFSNLDNSVLTNFQRGKGGFLGFSKQFQNGKVWVQTKGGEIQNAGVVKQMTSKSNSSASKSIKVVRVSGRLDAKNSR